MTSTEYFHIARVISHTRGILAALQATTRRDEVRKLLGTELEKLGAFITDMCERGELRRSEELAEVVSIATAREDDIAL